MRTEDVFNLSLKEFEAALSPINYEYVEQVFKSTVRAWGSYREVAELSTEETFPEVNEYFNNSRKNSPEYAAYLRELYE